MQCMNKTELYKSNPTNSTIVSGRSMTDFYLHIAYSGYANGRRILWVDSPTETTTGDISITDSDVQVLFVRALHLSV